MIVTLLPVPVASPVGLANDRGPVAAGGGDELGLDSALAADSGGGGGTSGGDSGDEADGDVDCGATSAASMGNDPARRRSLTRCGPDLCPRLSRDKLSRPDVLSRRLRELLLLLALL